MKRKGFVRSSDRVEFIGINNPRQENGDFGPEVCDKCFKYSTAYVFMSILKNPLVLCKSCLLDAVDIIDKTILTDCVEKGKMRHGR